MILGTFGDEDELNFDVELIAANGLELPINVMLDTGFSGWIAIDEQDLQGLDWNFLGERDMRLASGETKFDIYLGRVRIEEQEFDVPVHVGQGVPEVLLGRQWLKNRRLVVDMAEDVLTLGN